uniref:Uncharacterized protein n=1 Tax=Schistocephalus solidus TaxID=70667 RepID=A0A0X3Q2V2_SCHSO
MFYYLFVHFICTNFHDFILVFTFFPQCLPVAYQMIILKFLNSYLEDCGFGHLCGSNMAIYLDLFILLWHAAEPYREFYNSAAFTIVRLAFIFQDAASNTNGRYKKIIFVKNFEFYFISPSIELVALATLQHD